MVETFHVQYFKNFFMNKELSLFYEQLESVTQFIQGKPNQIITKKIYFHLILYT